MTRAAQGDVLVLVNAGTAANGQWRGGRGVAVCSVAGSISSAELQMQVDDAWVDVTDITGDPISFSAVGMFNFELPACGLRINGTVTGATVKVIGV